MAEPDKFTLLKAAYRGDLQAVKGHLKSYTADVRGVRNCTCLHAAACSINSEVVDVLLQEGGDINWLAADGATPLHVAAAAGNSRVAERLLQSPLVDRDKRLDSSGFTALHLAVSSGDADTVAVLLKAGATFDLALCKGITPLHLAADLGAEGILLQLLDSHLEFSRDQTPTALHFACSVPCFDTVAPALQVLSCVDWMGPLPLNPQLLQAVVCATEQHHLESVIPKSLHQQSFIAANLKNVQQAKSQRLQSQSSINLVEEEEPPAQKGFFSGILKALGCGGLVAPKSSKSLKTRDKDIAAANNLEQEPHVATWMRQIDSLQANRFSRCAQMLITWGCKVNARTPEGHSPLMYAAQACDLPLVSLLLEEKASVLDVDDHQRSALHWCVNSAGPDSPQAQDTCNMLIALLIEQGLQVNTVDSAECTPLQIACSHGNVVGVKALCKYGAQPDEKALLACVGTRDELSRLAIVRYLLDVAAMEPSLHGSRASVIANEAVSRGPSDAAALILQRQKAKGTAVTVPDSSWLAAAEHVTDDDTLLQYFPLNTPATAVALGKAWRSRKEMRITRSSHGGFSDDGSDERQQLHLPHSTTSDLLKRVCKGPGPPPVDELGNTLLHLAVLHADKAEVAFLAKHNGLCATKNAAGDLPVHILLREHAASSTLLPWVTQLMAGGVTADMPDGHGIPMLCYAAEAGNKDVVKWLLDSKAYASAADKNGRGPLHYAAKGSIHRVEVVRESYDLPSLISAGVSVPNVFRRSSAPQPPGHLGTSRRTTDDDGRSQAGVSLFQALKDLANAYASIIDMLVEHGAGVTATDLKGNTPVHEASTGAKIDIIKQLVAKGADLTLANKAGETCLHVAARHKSTQTVSYLVKEGAPLEAEDPNGRTPLHYACYHSSAEVISGLCRLQANVNHVDSKRRTPLHVVVYRKHAGTHAYGTHSLPSCRALVQHGAHINEPDSKMRTPLVLAYMFNHIRVAHYLWGRGAEPERSYGHHSRLFKQALQVADIALVKHLLVNSRTLEVYHKDPSGASFLEVVIKELETKPFIAYADCVDNLLGLRVPISLPALTGLWYHIAAKAEKIGWVIDEEYNPEQEAMEASKASHRRMSRDGTSASLKAELEALNSKIVPVGAAEISKSVLSISTGSAVRVSVGPDRLLAPVLEQEMDEGKDDAKLADPFSPGHFLENLSSNGSISNGSIESSGPEAVTNSPSPLAPRSPPLSGQLRASNEEHPLLTRNGRAGDSSPPYVKFDAAETVPAGRKEPPDGRKGAMISKLSKSTGSANVSSTFSVNPVRRISAGSSTTLQATDAVVGVEQDGDDDVDFATLATTPSGLQALRWNVALGELLAHESDLLLPRPVVIKSLRSALRASSMMLVQWRVDPTAVRLKLPETGETALHVAVKCEMWVAAAELLRRGADTCVTDKAGRTPLDAAVNKLCSRGVAATVDQSATAEEKVKAIRSCFKFRRLPESRKSWAEDFLSAHLQCDGTSIDDAFATAPDGVF